MMLKRLFYLGLGLSTHLLVFIGAFKLVFVNLITQMNKSPIPLKLFLTSLLTLLVIATFQLILFALSYWQREVDSIIFYYFFKTLKKKKIVHHEQLGKFLLILDKDNDLVLYKQNWFVCERIGYFSLGSVDNKNTEILYKNIELKLNGLYKNILSEQNKKKEESEKIKRIMSWDGHLSKVTRRDDKLNQLGIK